VSFCNFIGVISIPSEKPLSRILLATFNADTIASPPIYTLVVLLIISYNHKNVNPK
jgi:hypothetical protein